MTDQEVMLSSTTLPPQPCGVKRTIDQVVEDHTSNHHGISNHQWQRLPYICPEQQTKYVPVAFDSTAHLAKTNSAHAATSGPPSDVNHTVQFRSLDTAHSTSCDNDLDSSSNSMFFNAYSSNYRTGCENLPLALRYNHNSDSGFLSNANANSPRNNQTIAQQQQQEVRQPQIDRWRNVELMNKYYDNQSSSNHYTPFTNNVHDATKIEEKYWPFSWSANCHRKSLSYSNNQSPCSRTSLDDSYNREDSHHNKFPAHLEPPPTQVTSQKIKRDENGKSYFELGAKVTFDEEHDWRSTWNSTAEMQTSYRSEVTQMEHCSAPAVDFAVCEDVAEKKHAPWLPSLPSNYRHQRLSVLSLSMVKLNHYRQCSDPSLHRSVLICNTLRHIEDEMEREESLSHQVKHVKPNADNQVSGDMVTCPTQVDNLRGNDVRLSDSQVRYHKKDNNGNGYAVATPEPCERDSQSNVIDMAYLRSTHSESNYTSGENFGFLTSQHNGGDKNVLSEAAYNTNAHQYELAKLKPVAPMYQTTKQSEETNREIDWSSVLSMSSIEFDGYNQSGFQHAIHPSIKGDFGPCDTPCHMATGSEEDGVNSSWKTNQLISDVSRNSKRSSRSEFSVIRRRNELADDLEGFVQILVGS